MHESHKQTEDGAEVTLKSNRKWFLRDLKDESKFLGNGTLDKKVLLKLTKFLHLCQAESLKVDSEIIEVKRLLDAQQAKQIVFHVHVVCCFD